jgi:hypothetical protein
MTLTRINGHSIKITDDSIEYRGRTYPIAGAAASYTTRRQGVPLISRRTVCEVTISGQGWQIAGRVRSFGSPQDDRAGRRLVQRINERAYQPDARG